MSTKKIIKKLSSNDTGETGGHQAGILVPKKQEILSFFPDLGCKEKNPRTSLYFEDCAGQNWTFHFIYYNNKFFDAMGTRNEYRLTGMTAYFRENGLISGDTIILTHDESNKYLIDYERGNDVYIKGTVYNDSLSNTLLVLSGGWKIINC